MSFELYADTIRRLLEDNPSEIKAVGLEKVGEREFPKIKIGPLKDEFCVVTNDEHQMFDLYSVVNIHQGLGPVVGLCKGSEAYVLIKEKLLKKGL